MTINLTVPQNMQELRPRITVVGVGGGGCNAVNNMINADLEGVDFIVANTDGQALAHSKASRKIQLGSAITQGLGAGSKPEIGRAAAEESLQEMMAELADCNMVFITAGMGGGTGTGAAPVIARAARERGILTVAVITKPFEFEGQRRMKQAEDGIEELQAYVDTLIIIPNQNLFRLANERTTFADAFHMADTVLHQGVCGVTNLMIKPGLINLDFADIRAVMGEMGKAMMGTGEASGDSRATQAAEAAINNPLLDDTTMKGAHAVLINITGGMDMTLFEVDEAANRIRKEVDTDATIIFGSAFDDRLEGVMRVSVVATGINTASQTNGLSDAHGKTAILGNLRHNQIMPDPLANSDLSQLQGTKVKISNSDSQETVSLAPSMPLSETQEENHDEGGKKGLQNPFITWEENTEDTDVTDNAHQLNIDDAIAYQENNDDTSQDIKGQSEHLEKINNEQDIQVDEQTAYQSHMTDNDAANVSKGVETPRAAFIPAQPTPIPDENCVPEAMETMSKRPISLINKISGLWSTKPDLKQQGSKIEPAISEPQPSASILDLSKSHDAGPNSVERDRNNGEASQDELDIPAFLRRQAN